MYKQREKLIEKYFESWVNKDIKVLAEVFADDIDYHESSGDAYKGILQLEFWFKNWFRHGCVMSWPVYNFIHQGNITVCKWRLDVFFNGNETTTYGVSWIQFDDNNKICKLSEYISASELIYPFDDRII